MSQGLFERRCRFLPFSPLTLDNMTDGCAMISMEEARVSVVRVLSSEVWSCAVSTNLDPGLPAKREVGPWKSHELGESIGSLVPRPSNAKGASPAGASRESVGPGCGNG